ncbi:interferon-induced protein with tetratricopeptide repeats 5-like [Engraulis encrasicolus]|uniref:interferon-induced protein with tetratricopeptide repeats 5-like n=1 Tax=Engraulis encrasicolus TaxID=184585 RepID=UPI002FD3037B
MSKKQATGDDDLKALECLFTWDVDKDDINDLKGVPVKLEDRVKYCPRRYHATYFNILAFVSHLQGKDKAAIAYLEKSLAVLEEEQRDEVDFLVTYSSFAWLHHHHGNLEAMETYLGKIRNIQAPTEVIVEEEKGWSLLRLGGKFYPRSRESFEKVLKAKPDSLSCNVGYAVVLYRQEEMVRTDDPIKPEESAAAQQLKKALELDPTDAEVMVLLALKLQRSQPGKSRELIRKAVIQSPDIPHVTRYAATYFRRDGSTKDSLEILEEASKRAPNSSFLYHQMGLCHWQNMINMKKLGGQRAGHAQVNAAVAESLRLFHKTVALKPSNTYAWVHLAEAYAERQQLEEAEPIFKTLLSDNALSDAERQHCHTKYGEFLMFKKKDDDKAIEQLKEAYAIRIDSKGRTQARARLQQLASRRSGWRNREEDILDFISSVDRRDRQPTRPPADVNINRLADSFKTGLTVKQA